MRRISTDKKRGGTNNVIQSVNLAKACEVLSKRSSRSLAQPRNSESASSFIEMSFSFNRSSTKAR